MELVRKSAVEIENDAAARNLSLALRPGIFLIAVLSSSPFLNHNSRSMSDEDYLGNALKNISPGILTALKIIAVLEFSCGSENCGRPQRCLD